jgi:putative SOS response-associated peptidase YedK
MCFNTRLIRSQDEILHRFNASLHQSLKKPLPTGYFNGFDHPQTPIICQQGLIEIGEWGLIPKWAKDTSIQKQTLNARLETLAERPSFKQVLNNRCLIIADGFYEWQWLDAKGKQKQKYLITLPGNSLYTYAGLYSDWQHPATLHIIRTYTIITTAANELMAQIHNSKKRMPVILHNEFDWLSGGHLTMANNLLIAEKVTNLPTTGLLF